MGIMSEKRETSAQQDIQHDIKERLSANVYGLLFADHRIMEYFDLEEKKIYTLAASNTQIRAILVHGDEVYYADRGGEVKSLFTGFKSARREYSINALQSHKDKILDFWRRWPV